METHTSVSPIDSAIVNFKTFWGGGQEMSTSLIKVHTTVTVKRLVDPDTVPPAR